MAPPQSPDGDAASSSHNDPLPAGSWKYPSYRDVPKKSSFMWLQGRREDCGAEGLWRVHDKLYDLSTFVENHPGGPEWLMLTKGTDITEAFEAHHISSMPQRTLRKYEVRPAKTPRNSPYTFHPNGFYATLRRRVYSIFPDAELRGPTFHTRCLADSLLAAFLVLSCAAAVWQNTQCAVLAGIILGMNTVACHNFFHLRDHFRRYYFDLSLMSNSSWRVSHALSHHLYPNSLYDLELSLFEPFLQWLPRPEKSLLVRFGSWLWSPLMYSILFPMEYIKRIVVQGFSRKDLLPLLIPMMMVYFAPAGHVWDTLKLWFITITFGSIYFSFVGLNAAHHHPEIWHDGDKERADTDWGLAQLDSVRDRPFISGVTATTAQGHDNHNIVCIDSIHSEDNIKFFLSMTNFGHHAVHHLFPTIDHGHLPKLYPLLEQTLSEFQIPFRTNGFMDLLKGQFRQLLRNAPNPMPPRSLG